MNRRLLWTALGTILIMTAGCAPVSREFAQTVPGQIAQLRSATTPFQEIAVAEAAGYAQFMDCIDEPGHGAMGIHFVNGALVEDAVLDVTRPEALVYAPPSDGDPGGNPNGNPDGLNLAAVEYIVFAEAWHAEHIDPPTLMEQTLRFIDSPNRYDLPPFYALHAWVRKVNPRGFFADWNPDVVCP